MMDPIDRAILECCRDEFRPLKPLLEQVPKGTLYRHAKRLVRLGWLRKEAGRYRTTETGRVNVRLIAATHRDLEAAVERGTFREDLYYRLRRGVLEVPPLRARGDDIRLLVEHFRVQLNERYGLSVHGATPAALRLLEHYPWRGNVRELEAVLEQAMIFKSGHWITPADLDLPMHRRGDVADITAGAARHGMPATKAALSWLQYEALQIAAARREVRRRDLIGRCRISREVARRELAGLVQLGLLRRVGLGRATRYVPPMSDAAMGERVV